MQLKKFWKNFGIDSLKMLILMQLPMSSTTKASFHKVFRRELQRLIVVDRKTSCYINAW